MIKLTHYLPRISLISLLVASLLLSACGGSGGSETDPPPGVQTNSSDDLPPMLPPPEGAEAGLLIDSAVAGIRYEGDTHSGVTDYYGRFFYVEGETVKFYLGNLYLGEALGEEAVTLFELLGLEPPQGIEILSELSKINYQYSSQASLSSVINLATLLQSLDDDNNPADGIHIQEDVAALFTQDSIDIHSNWTSFHELEELRRILIEAKDQGYLPENRQLVKPWSAMSHLYQSIGVDSQLVATTTEFTQVNDTDEGNYTIERRFSYDAAGKIVDMQIINDDGSGDPLITSYRYEYDANENLILLTRDDQRGGEDDFEERFEYNDNGQLLFYSINSRVAISSVADFQDEYTYNSAGQLTQLMRTYFGEEPDLDGDNGYRYDYEYDAQGRLSTEVLIPNDGGSELRTYSYNTDGGYSISHKTISEFEDSSVYLVRVYNEKKQLVSVANDTNNDGELDSLSTTEYDQYGNRTRYQEDDNNDGTPERSTTFTHVYDAEGNLLSTTEVNDTGWVVEEFTDGALSYLAFGSGELGSTPDSTYSYEYTYDAKGLLSTTTSKGFDAGESFNRETTFSYKAVDGWWQMMLIWFH